MSGDADQPTRPPSECSETQPSDDVFHRLVKALNDASVPFAHLHHQPVFTSQEAAAARGTPLHSGAKALILRVRDTFILAVMPADLSLDSHAMRKHLGCKRLRFATKEEVRELTGLTPGSIPPFGSLFGVETICDERLAENERINFNAGSHTESLQVPYDAYIAYETPVVARIATDERK